MGNRWPDVAVVMPIRNEADDLAASVEAVLAQEYPGRIEVCLAVAPSTDDTAAIAERLAADEPRLRVVSNPSGTTPAGLNAAIAATTAPVVVRVDGHARLGEGYVRRAVETLRDTGAVNVGGRQVPRPRSTFERSVADATTSLLGTGGARYRVGATAGPTDTVYLGVFDRAAGDAVGWYDERLVRNQDYELNVRLRAAGGTVWFDPGLTVDYRPRSSPTALARQYFEYGWWKSVVVRGAPGSTRPRQVIPAAVTAVLAAALVIAPWRPRALLAPFGYLGVCVAAGWHRCRDLRRSVAMARALALMHLAWGAGFWTGVADAVRRSVGVRAR